MYTFFPAALQRDWFPVFIYWDSSKIFSCGWWVSRECFWALQIQSQCKTSYDCVGTSYGIVRPRYTLENTKFSFRKPFYSDRNLKVHVVKRIDDAGKVYKAIDVTTNAGWTTCNTLNRSWKLRRRRALKSESGIWLLLYLSYCTYKYTYLRFHRPLESVTKKKDARTEVCTFLHLPRIKTRTTVNINTMHASWH